MRNALVVLAGAALFAGCANQNHEEQETPVTLDSVPAAVREAIRTESGGAPVQKIVREDEKGKTIYEATITKDGKTYEVEMDETGKILERESGDDKED